MRSVTIPRTKLQPPALRERLVARPRLRDVFLERRPLTVIAAPAGSGKTTLVLEWLAAQPVRAAWLSLEADDNDPVRFIHGVIAALRGAVEDLHIPAGQRNLKPILTEIINQLNEAGPLTLVLDDYHVISEEAIHSALTYLLEHIPPTFQLILTTREEPPLPLARLRVRGQVQEIHLQDLRFTVEETRAFLNDVMGLNLSNQQVLSLEERTQGWIAGLQMVGLSLQSSQAQAIPAVDRGQFITEYLLTEIFDRQPPAIQAFLLNTSIVERFSLPLCRDLVPGNAARLLDQVQKANLFLTAVDAWHQYHPLFRDFLQTHLQNQFPERVVDLHRQALLWLERNGMVAEAIQHAFAIPDPDTSARLIAEVAPDYLKRGELVTLRRWLDRLPEPMVWSHPRLCMTRIWLLLDSNLQVDAAPYFKRMGSFLEKNLRGEFLAVRALHAAMSHQPDAALRFARRAQKSAEANDPFIQTYVSFGLGAAQKMGLSFFQAEQSFRDSLALADADHNSYIAIASLVNLADVLYLQARLHDAERVCRQALKRFSESTPDACDWYWTLGRIAYQRNELEEALTQISRAIELSAEAQATTLHSRALLQRAMIYDALGKKKLMQADLDEADRMARGLQDQVILRAVIRQRVLIAVNGGDLLSAPKWLQVLNEYGEQPFPFYLAYARGRLWLAEKKVQEANTEFESALHSLEHADFALVRIEVMVWQAVCLHKLGRPAQAAGVLQHAIRAAQTERVIRPFLEAKEGLLSLIEISGREHFGWILEFLRGDRKQVEGPALTRREREILQLLALGMSNQEMAEKLVIAEGTLKRHVANLYHKLGVHNRTQAIRHFKQQ